MRVKNLLSIQDKIQQVEIFRRSRERGKESTSILNQLASRMMVSILKWVKQSMRWTISFLPIFENTC